MDFIEIEAILVSEIIAAADPSFAMTPKYEEGICKKRLCP